MLWRGGMAVWGEEGTTACLLANWGGKGGDSKKDRITFYPPEGREGLGGVRGEARAAGGSGLGISRDSRWGGAVGRRRWGCCG